MTCLRERTVPRAQSGVTGLETARFGPIAMEQVWNRGAHPVANVRPQEARKRLELARNRCARLPPAAVGIAW
jgi:hypothetical protein